MAKIEILKKNITYSGRLFMVGTVHDEKVFGPEVKQLKGRGLIGPVTKATKASLNAEAALLERPMIEKAPKDTTGDDGDKSPAGGDSGNTTGDE